MSDPQSRVDIHTRIENALARLSDPSSATPAQAVHSLRLATKVIEAAQAAIGEREQELEALTDPGLDAAKEVVLLRKQLEQKDKRIVELEMQVFESKTELEVNVAMAVEDTRERQDLQRRVRDFDKKLMSDDAAFDSYMDSAMDDMGTDSGGR